MQHRESRLRSCLALLYWLQSGCIVDKMPPDIYADAGSLEVPDGSSGDPSLADAADAFAPGSDEDPEPIGDAGAADAGGDLPPAPGCDLTGPWLITERLVATGLGAQQAALWWLYYEFEQSGERLRVKKGLVCGTVVQPIGLVSASVDMHGSWPKILQNNPHTGRSGRSHPSAGGCNVSLAKTTTVMGATMPHYADQSHALPSLEQPASGSSPGWEDWDDDSKPGITLHVSGLATGVRYTSTRTSSSWSGDIKSGAKLFKLRSTWQQDDSVYGASSDALKGGGARDADPTLHFAQFAKLDNGQVSGDDTTLCKKLRELAPTLTAEANK